MAKKKLSSSTSGPSLVSIDIHDMAFPNDYGVGKAAGYVLFVPGALPQDRIKAEIVKRGKHFGYARMVSLEQPSPLRIKPPCPHFGLCGGCTLQNIGYQHQLLMKERYLHETLKRVGDIDATKVDVLPICPSPLTYSYRSKIELSFGEEQGQAVLGLRQRLSPFEKYDGSVIPLHGCMNFSATLTRIIPVFTDYARSHRLACYNMLTRRGTLRRLIVREAKASGDIMVILEATTGRLPDTSGLWQAMIKTAPEIKSFFCAVNRRTGDSTRFEQILHVGGHVFIEEKVDPWIFRVHPESFFQPNPKSAETLYRQIPSMAPLSRDETMLGLYCGMGPIEISLSPFVKTVTGIDSLPQNIANAVENSLINNRSNCTFLTGAVERLHVTGSITRPDITVVDPPRGGLTPAACNLIATLKPRKLIYISCNPSTLARDLKLFIAKGYTIGKIAPFDFFPHTSHSETFVYLQDHL
ncbi:MAG TPA: 23S rRNA (uracil(1939)-C(5))-methyltransferase RlmD [Syntrophorhabdaceae bacterium]|nr:23S rRNA (uracil(1939)-C(5))-methyltransferase RlmD [Syntrophorhabdaceae bacterium]